MKNTIILALIFLFSTSLSAQKDYSEYYNLIGRGYTEYVQKDYHKAIETFELTFSKYYPFPNDVNVLKECYLAIDDKEKAYQAMRRMVLCGFKLESSIPLINSGMYLANYKLDTRSGDTILEQRLLQEYPAIREEYLKNIDWNIDQCLKILTHFEIHTALMRTKSSSTKINNLIAGYGWEINKEMFMNLMDSKKCVDRELTDTWTSYEMEVAILHISQSITKEDYQRYFQLLKEQVLQGNVSNFNYAAFYDNYLYRNKKGTYYGQQMQYHQKTGKRKCARIEDVNNVDKRRAEIGLPPLWIWCELHSIELPEGYQKKD
jgi:tetratricopeptide (TPR) repeat protein